MCIGTLNLKTLIPFYRKPVLTKLAWLNFHRTAGISVPDGTTAEKAQWILQHHDAEWRDWRCQVIVDVGGGDQVYTRRTETRGVAWVVPLSLDR